MASSIPEIAHLMDNNAEFAKTYSAPVTMTQMRSKLLANPNAGSSVILTCLDPRVVPEKFFGPDMRSAVMRNAGGRASDDAIASMVVLRSLGNLKNVLVIHHTDCGMSHLTEEQIAGEAKKRTPAAAEWIEGKDFGTFKAKDFEKTIKKDVLKLRGAKVLEGTNVFGMMLDTPTGVVRELDV